MSDKTLVQHMAEVMKEVGYVQKDATNDFQNYTYASAQAVFDKVRAELSSRGIAVCGDVELVASEIIGVPGKQKHIVVAKHTVTFTDGKDSISVSALGEGIDSGDKASMKGNTAGVKYCLAKAFLISWGDDPEADSKTDEPEKENLKVDQVWIPACESASNTTAEKFAGWWPKYKDQIKAECGTEGAATVYATFTMYLKRLKAEA